MPFIGNQPALSYTSFAKQDFTTSATTSYTLNNPVTNANELALFINFVRQEPTTAYSASGTSLTLTSATSATDDMYCVFLGKAVQTVNPPNGSVGASQIADSSIALGKLSATGTKDATTFLRGDNTFAEAGGGKVLQVVTATDSTNRTTSSSSFVTASNTLSVTITPSSASNKVLVTVNTGGYTNLSGDFYLTIYRDAVNLGNSNNGMLYLNNANGVSGSVAMHILDTPSSTSAITYQVYFRQTSGVAVLNFNNGKGSITAMEIQG